MSGDGLQLPWRVRGVGVQGGVGYCWIDLGGCLGLGCSPPGSKERWSWVGVGGTRSAGDTYCCCNSGCVMQNPWFPGLMTASRGGVSSIVQLVIRTAALAVAQVGFARLVVCAVAHFCVSTLSEL